MSLPRTDSALRLRQEIYEGWRKRVCVVSAILNAPDVTKACAEFWQQLE